MEYVLWHKIGGTLLGSMIEKTEAFCRLLYWGIEFVF